MANFWVGIAAPLVAMIAAGTLIIWKDGRRTNWPAFFTAQVVGLVAGCAAIWWLT